MAFRIEAFFALSLTLAAQPFEFTAQQDRILRDRPVALRVDDEGLAAGPLKWAWDDIQQLTLNESELRLLGYKDSKLRGFRDREWLFEKLPKDLAATLYPFLSSKLDNRLIAAIALRPEALLWEIPVKLHSGIGGSEGVLSAGADLIVYRSPERNESRTWRIAGDIDSVSSSGPRDLVLTTAERRGLLHSGTSDFRFQLKRPLSEERYQALWRRIQKSKGLEILRSYQGDNSK